MSDIVPKINFMEVNIKDESNELSIVSMCKHEELKNAIRRVPEELFEKTEGELRMYAGPTDTDEMIKLSFWNEVEEAQARGGRMIDHVAIYSRACSRDYFFKRFLKHEHKVAWMLTPPPQYVAMVDMLLHRGMQRMSEVLNMPIKVPMRTKEGVLKDENGNVVFRPDMNTIREIARITKDLDKRKHGAIPQVTKNLHVHKNADASPAMTDQKIRDLEKKLGQEIDYTEVSEPTKE